MNNQLLRHRTKPGVALLFGIDLQIRWILAYEKLSNPIFDFGYGAEPKTLNTL